MLELQSGQMLLFDGNTTLGISWILLVWLEYIMVLFCFFFNSILYHRSVVFSERFLQMHCIGICAVENCVVSITCAALYFDTLRQFEIMFGKSYGSFIFSVMCFSSPKKQI